MKHRESTTSQNLFLKKVLDRRAENDLYGVKHGAFLTAASLKEMVKLNYYIELLGVLLVTWVFYTIAYANQWLRIEPLYAFILTGLLRLFFKRYPVSKLAFIARSYFGLGELFICLFAGVFLGLIGENFFDLEGSRKVFFFFIVACWIALKTISFFSFTSLRLFFQPATYFPFVLVVSLLIMVISGSDQELSYVNAVFTLVYFILVVRLASRYGYHACYNSEELQNFRVKVEEERIIKRFFDSDYYHSRIRKYLLTYSDDYSYCCSRALSDARNKARKDAGL